MGSATINSSLKHFTRPAGQSPHTHTHHTHRESFIPEIKPLKDNYSLYAHAVISCIQHATSQILISVEDLVLTLAFSPN